ncbi:MAG TPA: cupin-like domain-containing protein [Candidatus Saccharimonadia bacterium]|nr:cupin-like domain-containing protein [Candidatus Saccharimonadia bacterium]
MPGETATVALARANDYSPRRFRARTSRGSRRSPTSKRPTCRDSRASARRARLTLSPGETLFMPTGWWHTTRAAEMHISVAWGQLGPDNRGEFVGDVRSIARHKGGIVLDGAVRTYLAAVGAIAWLRE